MQLYSFIICLTGFVAVQGAFCSIRYGRQSFPGRSCADILRERCGRLRDGVYWIALRKNGESIPVFCDMRAGGWTLVFKAVAAVPGTISHYWKLRFPVSEYSIQALNKRKHFRRHYKNRIVHNWKQFNPNQARVVVYKHGKEKLALRFNAKGTDNINWFSMKNLQESPWVDIASRKKNFFTLSSSTCQGDLCRDFFINHSYGGCPKDTGWLAIGNTRFCPWERKRPNPSFIFSKVDQAANYNDHRKFGNGDVFSVYLR